jgi:hypothetical protein
MVYVLFIVIAVFFGVYVLLPFWEKSYRRKKLDFSGTERENLVSRKAAILDAMRDLEYDFKMQKITEDDYNQVKTNLTKEAVDIMKKLDQLDDAKSSNKRS